MDMTRTPVRRALVSVYDKTGLEELGRGLAEAGVEVVSTGSTAARLREAGVAVTAVDELTGFPECLDGRVKTLHPKVHAGILADLRLPDHVRQLEELGIAPFELVVVNLYPFEQTVASGAAPDECVEQIDIGGPTMVRAAAKNSPSVAVVVEPGAYAEVLAAVAEGGTTLDQRRRLAGRAFAHTAAYDTAVASWFSSSYAPADDERFPAFLGATWERKEVLRYGENPHQGAALYVRPGAGDSLATAEQLHGKAMSYNNYVDTDAALRAAHDFADPCVAIIKHANPCGIAVGTDVADAHAKAHACDPVSAFGGVIATNRPVSLAMAQQVAEVFTEVVVAPAYDDGAVELLSRKPSIRLLVSRRRPQPRGAAAGRRRRAAAGPRPVPGAGRRPRLLDARDRGGGGRGAARRPRLRLAGCARGEEQRDPARAGRRDRRRRHGTGQPRRRGPARRVPGGGAGRRVGRGLRRVLPVPRRAAGPARRRGARGRAAGRIGARRRGRRGGAGGRGDDLPHGHPPLRALVVQDFSREVLEGRTFTGERLVGADFSEAQLTRVVFEDCDLTGAELTSAVLDTCAFLGCRMERTRLFGSVLRGCKLTGSTFVRAALRPLTVEGGDWSWVSLRSADLRGVGLAGLSLAEADLTDADLSGADLSGADLTRAQLRGVRLRGADLRGAQLDGCDVDAVDWREVRIDLAQAVHLARARGAVVDG